MARGFQSSLCVTRAGNVRRLATRDSKQCDACEMPGRCCPHLLSSWKSDLGFRRDGRLKTLGLGCMEYKQGASQGKGGNFNKWLRLGCDDASRRQAGSKEPSRERKASLELGSIGETHKRQEQKSTGQGGTL